MHLRLLPLFLLSIGLPAACAKNPESIAPVLMPGGMYNHMTCDQARAERLRLGDILAALETRQRSAETGDAIGVFLIGVPVASLTGGDRAGLIAAERGKVLVLDARLQRC